MCVCMLARICLKAKSQIHNILSTSYICIKSMVLWVLKVVLGRYIVFV